MNDKKVKRIVLTGGPGGGKSTAADLIRRELGEKIVVVPEAATLLFAGGFPRSKESHARKAAQKAIFHVQRNMEDLQHALYPKRTLLCDRGTLDSAVFWPDGCESFCQSLSTTVEHELSRYDEVVFFESAAVGNISIEGGNTVRLETNEEAVELDSRLRDVWSKHPNFVHIPHQESFFKKLQSALDAISRLS